MDLELDGKRALVTGGSKGIGKAIARVLAEEGVDVAICARSEETLRGSAQEIADATGRRVVPVVGDVRIAGDVEKLVESAASALGGLDILVNNAGVPGGLALGPIEAVSDEAVVEDLQTKFLGALRCSRAAVPHMKQGGWGRILCVGGLSARGVGRMQSPDGSEPQFNYSTGPRNLGMIHLVRTLAHELGGSGITANAVLPGATRTEDIDGWLQQQAEAQDTSVEALLRQTGNAIGRWVDAQEVAHVVAFLASPKAIAISGESVAVSGGGGTGIYL